MKKLPTCCGSEMKVSMELGRFLEIKCQKCGDVIYMKKYEAENRPIMLDD